MFFFDPGKLRQRVKLQAQGARTSDGGGGYTTRWRDVVGAGALPACFEALQGNEQLRAMQTEAQATHRVTIRYRSGVTAAMRFLLGSRAFEIVAPPVDPEERHQWLQILVREST